MTFEYTDVALKHALPVSIFLRPASDIMADLVRSFASDSRVIDDALMLEEYPSFPSSLSRLLRLNLPGFNAQKIMVLSQNLFKKESDYVKTISYSSYDTLIRYMAQTMPSRASLLVSDVTFIGDFSEISNAVQSVTSSMSPVPLVTFEWKGFVPDPYSSKPYNFNVHDRDDDVHISGSYPQYDTYCNQNWYCGQDGTSLLTDTNLNWIATKPNLKSAFVVGAISMSSYLNADLDTLEYHYRLTIAVLASCNVGSSASIKMPLPTNKGFMGLLTLFSLCFKRTNLLRFKKTSPDDNTCYLVGIGFTSFPAGLEKMTDRNSMKRVLFNLTTQISDFGQELNRNMGKALDSWISRIKEQWSIRDSIRF
jgi:hypothetical protein